MFVKSDLGLTSVDEIKGNIVVILIKISVLIEKSCMTIAHLIVC